MIIRNRMLAIVGAFALASVPISSVTCASSGCAAFASSEAKAVARPVIDLAEARCIARAATETEALLCNAAREVVRFLYAARREGEERSAAARRQSAGRPLDDGGVE